MQEFDLEALLESEPEYDEFDEAVRGGRGGGRPSPLRLPPRGNATVQPLAHGVATKAELDATARRLDDRIATVSSSVKALDSRTHATNRELGSVSTALRREIARRKTETADLRKSVDESRQIAMIMPLIGGGSDPISKMLPIMLYGGMLGGTGSSGTSGSDNNSMMMTMMMALVLSQQP